MISGFVRFSKFCLVGLMRVQMFYGISFKSKNTSGMQAKVVSWCSIQISNVWRYYTLLKEEELGIYFCVLRFFWEFCSPQMLCNMEIGCAAVEGKWVTHVLPACCPTRFAAVTHS